ncbi:MAG: hypothetical protein WBW04_02000 [Nitrolancea sp.]
MLNARRVKSIAWWPVLLLLAACMNAGTTPTHSDPAASTANEIPSGVLSVRDAVADIAAQPSTAPQQSLVVDAHINQPTTDQGGAIAPPANCPVVIASLPTLTDQLFVTEFTVAGATLPNSIPKGLPSLNLVIPFSLGIIDLPSHAQLHGHVFDPTYASCPNARKLFILDGLDNPGAAATKEATPNNGLTASWQSWTDPAVGFGLNYPDGWSVQTTHNVGSVASAVFDSVDSSQTVSLDVTAGQTYWADQTTDSPPEPLQGDRQVLAKAGPALARLVDIIGDATDEGHQRRMRLVFNYGGNTVILSTRFVDGIALDPKLLGVFTGMASSFHFDKELGVSDPMDPTLTASDKIGSGPFIGVDTAISIATGSSGLTQTTVDKTEMVSEKAAREASPGVCREFQERPQAVWLVTLSGTKPTGEKSTKVVYLDAVTGESICQTDVTTQS